MVIRLLVATFTLLASPALFGADSAKLNLPEFSHLQGKATETVDITVGPFMMWLAGKFAPEKTDEGVRIRDMLKGIEAVYIRSYSFDSDGQYSKSDIDKVRDQLDGDLWKPLAQIHSKTDNEDVHIYVAIQNDKPAGFAIVASDPREFTIVNVVGTMDIEALATLQSGLGLPGGRISVVNAD